MGNICRSPTAEAVFTKLIEEAQLAEKVLIDSAGTHSYHIGEPPDTRSIEAGKKRGYELAHLVARQVSHKDFDSFDLIIAMDSHNHEHLLSICPEDSHHKVCLLLEHVDTLREKDEVDVPDPYYGGEQGFARVIDLIEQGSQALLERIKKEQGW